MEEGIVRLDRTDYDRVVRLWEASVRATHGFLRGDDLQRIRRGMKSMYLPPVRLYGIENDGTLDAFLGMGGKKIEMLFVRPEAFGRGLGKRLLRYAVDRLGATLVDVNEQNVRAAEFYRRQGFRVLSREARDGQGRDYPVLHLVLEAGPLPQR